MSEVNKEGSRLNLQWFNSLSPEPATEQLLQCCGAQLWARQLVKERPFQSLAELKSKAEQVWWSLTAEDWLEAFRSHPKIGERSTAQALSNQAQSWSTQEQSDVNATDYQTAEELRRLNNEYETKFGFIFIVCATGKSSRDILEILNTRISNDPSREIQQAASEQAKITELRLQKLFD